MWIDDGYDRERSDLDNDGVHMWAAGSDREPRDTADWLDWLTS